MIRVVADDRIPFLKGALEAHAKVDYLPGAMISPGDVRDADALIVRTRTRCDRALLGGSSVRFIATATIGFDHIDAEYCREAGIAWTSAPGCNSSSVEQYLVSTLLYLSVEKGLDLNGSVLGIVGVGNVGAKVARIADALGLKVLLNDPPRARKEGPAGFVRLDQILGESDIISFHVPLNRTGEDRTLHLAGRDFFSRVKPGLILVNTSRGPVVEEKALVEALDKGMIAHAVLDVYESEPNVDKELLERLTLATPHIAGYSMDGKAGGTRMSVQALSRHFGLGMDDWLPSGLPQPERKEILADASGNLPEVLWEVYRNCYDVESDHRRLRESPEAFELLRGEYPFRREAPAYAVRLFQGYPRIREVLEKLGFSVLSDSCM